MRLVAMVIAASFTSRYNALMNGRDSDSLLQERNHTTYMRSSLCQPVIC